MKKANANAWHHQTGSFESMKKTMQKPCSGWSCGWSCNGSFGGSSGLRSARSRNSQTPAGFKPNLSKNQPPKKCLTSPSDAPTTPHRARRNRDRNMPRSDWIQRSPERPSSCMRNSDTPAGFKRRFLMPYRKMKNSQRNCLTSSNMATAWHHLTCSTVARKGLEEHRLASIRNSETPQQDKTI